MAERNKQVFTGVFLTIIFVVLLTLPVIMAHIREPISDGITKKIDTVSALNSFGFFLNEVAEVSGINFMHLSPELDPDINPILPQIASMGASVSICDYNKDGWNDIYVTNSSFGNKNSLFRNQQDGSFIDVAVETGVADLNKKDMGVSMGSVWADYNNDGFEDLFVYRYGKPELFRNEQGKTFTRVTEKSGLPDWINANTAIWCDYNSDGLVDLFIGGYFPEGINLWELKSTRILTESFEYSQNGGRNYLFENNGDGTFSDVTFKAGLTSTRWTLAAGSADMNMDGFPELIIANDYGVDEFYFNDNGEKFIEKSAGTMIGFAPKSGMNVSFGDVSNNGKLGIYISNITEEGILLQGNNFWVPENENGKIIYENSARLYGIESGGWSYCAQFGDLNNDGFLDLYLANGYISAAKGTDYWYDYAKVTGGNASIISDIKNWPAMNGRSHSGYQQNKIWLSEGSNYFTDVAGFVAEKENYDSRAVAFADLWNRGTLDIIVANQNNKLLIYKNHVLPHKNWIAFQLEGTTSNKSAVNAIVELHWGTNIQSQVVTGGIGFCSQNQRRVHFGLGHHPKVEKAVIVWPGGKKQTLENPEINQLILIKEKHDE